MLKKLRIFTFFPELKMLWNLAFWILKEVWIKTCSQVLVMWSEENLTNLCRKSCSIQLNMFILKKSLFWSPPGPIVLLPFLEWHQKSLLLFFLFFFPMSSFFKPIRTFCRFLRRGLEKQMCSSSIPFEKWTSIKVLEINWIWLGKDILQYPISIIAPQCLNLQKKSHFLT